MAMIFFIGGCTIHGAVGVNKENGLFGEAGIETPMTGDLVISGNVGAAKKIKTAEQTVAPTIEKISPPVAAPVATKKIEKQHKKEHKKEKGDSSQKIFGNW